MNILECGEKENTIYKLWVASCESKVKNSS